MTMTFAELPAVIGRYLLTLRLTDLLDIAIMAFAMYHVFRLVQSTKTASLLKGLIVFFGLLLASAILELHGIYFILSGMVNIGVLALIILFQPEIRRILEEMGSRRFISLFMSHGENVDVIISVGKKFDIRKLKNIPENVLVYPSVPQLEVLKMADVFVTHGGMNSVSEALAYGVPMVVIPFVSDQPVNARCIEKLGVGKKLEYSDVKQNVLKEMAFSVIMDSEIKNNMKKMQQLINEVPGNKGGAEMVIKYFNKCK